tara:strand:+ start:685 stop:1782 length:1098 start_codon:yes stop_codon:yes gene_type:complete
LLEDFIIIIINLNYDILFDVIYIMDKELIEAIDKYYSYKSKYNNDYKDKVEKLRVKYQDDEDKSILIDKIKEIKMPCIFCKRRVNSNFFNKDNHLLITCGDNQTPCRNKLNILKSRFKHLNKIIEETNEFIKEIKKNITLIKLDLTYELISEEEALKRFKELHEELNENTNIYMIYLRKKMNIENDDERSHMIVNKIHEIEDFQKQSVKILNLYNKEKKPQLLSDYAENIKDYQMVEKEKLQNLIYSFQEVVSNEDEKNIVEHELIQSKVLFELYDTIIDVDDPKIIQNQTTYHVNDNDNDDDNIFDKLRGGNHKNEEQEGDGNLEEIDIGLTSITSGTIKLKPKEHSDESDDESDYDSDDDNSQ